MQPITFSISSENTSLTIDPDDLMLNTICDRFSIGFDVVSTGSYNASEVYRLLASLNDLPDILIYDARWELNYFIQSNSIIPLPEDLYSYLNLSAFIAYPYARALQYDGKLWGIPSIDYSNTSNNIDTCAVFYKKIYDAAWNKADPPETIEDWHELLSRIHELYPDQIPLTSRKPQTMFDLTYYYSPATYNWIWNENRYIPGYYSNEYCQSINALKTLWDAGLLDPDFMNQGSGRPQGLDKFILGQAAGIMYTSSSHTWQSEFIPVWQAYHPDESIEDSLQLVFLPCGINGEYYESYNYNMTSIYFGANIEQEALNRVLSLLDWLCSSEGYMLRRYGLKNEDYTFSEDGSLQTLTAYSDLYHKYPSFSFFRLLPDQDSAALTIDNEESNISFISKQYNEWRQKSNIRTLPFTSILANTVSTPAVLNFHPNILRNGYRMLTSTDIEKEFTQIKQEYDREGIQLMIDSVYYSLH